MTMQSFYGKPFGVWCKTATNQWYIGGLIDQTEAETYARNVSETHANTMVTVASKEGNIAAFLNGKPHDHSPPALMQWLASGASVPTHKGE